jgi:hypothetical protein
VTRVCLGILAGALTSCLAAGEADLPAWDWLPRATDDDRICELHLAAGPGWSTRPAAGLESRRSQGQLVVLFEPRLVPAITIGGPADATIAVRMLAPGKAAGLACDADGRLRIGPDSAILAVPRREAISDRRWGVLRLFEGDRPEPCRTRLDEPAPAPLGNPVLTRQIAAAQELKPGGSVLCVLSGDDRFVGWKHREYRQALSWLVADLIARGASRVVLVEPACPEVDEPMLAPLRAQVRDVARVHRCPVIDTTTLGAANCWEIAPGVLGTALNDAGRQARELLLVRSRWLAGG